MKRPGWLGGWLALVLAAGPAQGATRVAVLLAGECGDDDLQAAGTALWKVLPGTAGAGLLDEAAMAKRLGRRSPQTLEEVQRQIEAARTDMYAGKDFRAQEQVLAALDEIQWLAFGAGRSALMASAEVLYAKILLNLGKRAEGEEAFRRVLRVMPNYRLDFVNFSPSTRANFDAVRRRLEQAKKSRLEVTSKPSGADVFLDGVKFGKTPFKGEIDPGGYQLVIATGGTASFPRAVDLSAPATVFADLEFEGRFSVSRHACLSGDASGSQVVPNAMRLGAVLGVERLMLVRFSGKAGAVRWLSAGLVDVRNGKVVREAGFRFVGAEQGSALAELAAYVLNGQPARRLVIAIAGDPLAEGTSQAGQETLTDFTDPSLSGAAPAVEPGRQPTPVSLGETGALLMDAPAHVMLKGPKR